MTLYAIREEVSFFQDCALIHPEQQAFDKMFHGVREVLERGDFRYSIPVDSSGRLRVIGTLSYFSEDEMPQMYVAFEILRAPPDGLISLRRVVTAADVRGGLHVS
ncbi:MAG: hypothetical protein H0W90_15680 [Actinobacteria bacterium]|nr:hypothetical protein [Actinomycetota bacterium]